MKKTMIIVLLAVFLTSGLYDVRLLKADMLEKLP